MAQNISDNFQPNTPKHLDNRWGVVTGSSWRPFNDLAEFNTFWPLIVRFPTQMFWVKNEVDSNKADLYALRGDKTPYKVLSDVDLSDYYTKTEINGFLTLKADKTYIDAQDEVLEIAISLKADQNYVDNVDSDLQDQINEKADSSTITEAKVIPYSDLDVSKETYTDIDYANKEVVLVDIISGAWIGQKTFSSLGVLTLGFTADPAFVGLIIGNTGSFANYVTQSEYLPAKEQLFGSDEVFGAPDALTGYTNNNTSEYTHINNLPVLSDGEVETISGYCNKLGLIRFNLWERLDTLIFRRLDVEVEVEATTLGVNTWTAGVDFDAFEIKKGWFAGKSIPTGGGLIGNKTRTNGVFTSTDNTPEDGQQFTFTIQDAEFGYNFGYRSYSLSERIDNTNDDLTAVDNKADQLILDTIKIEDLEILDTTNLARSEYKKDGVLINNSGQKSFSAGWLSFRIPVIEDTDYTFGNFSIDTGGYSSFWDETENPDLPGALGLLQYNGLYTNGNLPVTIHSPIGATWLYFDVKRPVNVPADYAETTINLGAILLPYEPAVPYIETIKNYPIGNNSGGDSNVTEFTDLTDVPQSYLGKSGKGLTVKQTEDGLENTEVLKQNGDAVMGTLGTIALQLDIPESNTGTAPIGVNIGDMWLDTQSGTKGILTIKL